MAAGGGGNGKGRAALNSRKSRAAWASAGAAAAAPSPAPYDYAAAFQRQLAVVAATTGTGVATAAAAASAAPAAGAAAGFPHSEEEKVTVRRSFSADWISQGHSYLEIIVDLKKDNGVPEPITSEKAGEVRASFRKYLAPTGLETDFIESLCAPVEIKPAKYNTTVRQAAPRVGLNFDGKGELPVEVYRAFCAAWIECGLPYRDIKKALKILANRQAQAAGAGPGAPYVAVGVAAPATAAVPAPAPSPTSATSVAAVARRGGGAGGGAAASAGTARAAATARATAGGGGGARAFTGLDPWWTEGVTCIDGSNDGGGGAPADSSAVLRAAENRSAWLKPPESPPRAPAAPAPASAPSIALAAGAPTPGLPPAPASSTVIADHAGATGGGPSVRVPTDDPSGPPGSEPAIGPGGPSTRA